MVVGIGEHNGLTCDPLDYTSFDVVVPALLHCLAISTDAPHDQDAAVQAAHDGELTGSQHLGCFMLMLSVCAVCVVGHGVGWVGCLS